jgi:hypothetical protein
MKFQPLLALLALLPVTACQTTTHEAEPADPAHRKELFALVSALEGTWSCVDSEGNLSTTRFDVSSGGTVVRETMFPGTPHEMTNMYTLDNNDLVMTHYCAGGNQPSMRASAMRGNALDFDFESVRDLDGPDETCMGEMTMVFNADGTVEERWSGLTDAQVDPAHGMVFKLKRQR